MSAESGPFKLEGEWRVEGAREARLRRRLRFATEAARVNNAQSQLDFS